MAWSGAESPVRRARVLPPETTVVRRTDEAIYLRSPQALGPYPRRLTDRLDEWAARAPDRTFLAERAADGSWRRLSYGAARDRVRRLAHGFALRGLSADRPIAILSGNSVEHAVVALAAMYAGVPYAPIAPAYSLVATEYTTLAHVWQSLRPALVFIDDPDRFARALSHLDLDGVEIVGGAGSDGAGATPLASLETEAADDRVSGADAGVTPSTVAKILYTSGSTGRPKGVINTHAMLCSNQEMIRTAMPFLAEAPPVLCDWLPWNHTFGGNHNIGIALYNGGTLYIDAGRPAPGAFDVTLTNLREIATSAYFNVPRGFDLLVPALRADREFRRHFFSKVQILFYAAAGLRQQVVDEIDALALDACGERIPWVTGLGATETSPFALCTGAMPVPVAGRIGVPVPGVDLKVAAVGSKWEARLRGPNVTPGYWRDDALTRAAFDEEGYYRFGDAVGFVDRADYTRGLTFEGRLAEDFKLSTGTWVWVGPLRTKLLAALGDVAQDVVIAGPNRDHVAVLVFPNLAACRALAGGSDGPARAILSSAAVRRRVRDALARFSADNPSTSTRVVRARLIDEPPSINAGELTDKGSINQRAVLEHRAALVDELYAAACPDAVLDIVEGDLPS